MASCMYCWEFQLTQSRYAQMTFIILCCLLHVLFTKGNKTHTHRGKIKNSHFNCCLVTLCTACQFEWRWKKYSKSSPRGMDKAVVAGDLPLSAPPQKLVELPVILRRWTALMQAQNEVQEWKQVQVEWHSQE